MRDSWASLGITVTGLIESYGGVVSPRMQMRTQFLPLIRNGDLHSSTLPLDLPLPAADSSITRPNWGVGFETPFLSGQHFSIRNQPDKAAREQWHLDTVDYMLYWQLNTGVFQIPRGIITNDRFDSWNAPTVHYGSATGANNPEFIVLNR